MNKYHIFLLSVFIYLISNTFKVSADTYLWVDENGLKHVTIEIPPANSEILKHFDENTEDIKIPKYFPNQAFSEKKQSDEFVNKWFSKYLYKMKEPIISEPITDKSEIYRFLWLRTFDAPLCIRINIHPNTASSLTIKKTNGAGGYIPGEIVKDKTVVLNKEQLKLFFDKLTDCNFWAMNSPARRGLDGAEWILEGAKKNNYHVVYAWSPKLGDRIREIGMLMMELASHSETEIY